ncbi:MAG: hypothetical protein GDA55_03890 [Cellvibrionales bacterium]|nr:hypothetical protein [Cellvibrionales bacterium]
MRRVAGTNKHGCHSPPSPATRETRNALYPLPTTKLATHVHRLHQSDKTVGAVNSDGFAMIDAVHPMFQFGCDYKIGAKNWGTLSDS